MKPGLAVVVMEDAAGAESMDHAKVIEDPGAGGPDRVIRIEIEGGPRDGRTVELRRQLVLPADVPGWHKEHGHVAATLPPSETPRATKLEPGREAGIIDVDSKEALPKVPMATPDGTRELAEGDTVRVVSDPGPEFADSADEARDRLVKVEVVKSLFGGAGTQGEVARKFIGVP
jgi:hypothetical protein